MKVSDEKMKMAYALGAVKCGKDVKEHRKIELKDVNEEWKEYEITGNCSGEKLNNSYSLWFRGDFGIETRFTRLMMIEDGWNLNHAVALFIAAIQMHKSEVKNE